MIKILFLAANPKDTDPLRLGEEVRAIQERLRLSTLRDEFVVVQEWAVRVADLQGLLLRHQPHIVHFSGHGSRAGEIVLEDATGQSKPVSPDALKRLFAVLRDNVRCVVLNACFSEAQAKGIAESVNCVVGMTRAIGDASAIAFAAGFYQGLGYGRSVREAFDLGCGQIDLEGLGDEDVPKLMLPKELVDIDLFGRPLNGGGAEPSDQRESVRRFPWIACLLLCVAIIVLAGIGLRVTSRNKRIAEDMRAIEECDTSLRECKEGIGEIVRKFDEIINPCNRECLQAAAEWLSVGGEDGTSIQGELEKSRILDLPIPLIKRTKYYTDAEKKLGHECAQNLLNIKYFREKNRKSLSADINEHIRTCEQYKSMFKPYFAAELERAKCDLKEVEDMRKESNSVTPLYVRFIVIAGRSARVLDEAQRNLNELECNYTKYRELSIQSTKGRFSTEDREKFDELSERIDSILFRAGSEAGAPTIKRFRENIETVHNRISKNQ